jgi:diguanylate cyclase (GGDEF)-like protein
MAVIVFDIDRFKAVNDHHGHAAGDAILRHFAEELSRSLRATDVVARMGGEEFALVLEGILPGRAEQVAERVRDAFASREMIVEGKSLKCTVSAGIALGSSERTAFDNVLNAADKALYSAKRAGRNRVELADFLHTVPPEPSRNVS